MWCDERLLVDVIGPKGVVSARLPQPFARIGSHPESDVVLADGPVSGRSLYLHATPGGLFCIDLRRVEADSTNGGLWLNPTDEVGIGRYWLRARLENAAPLEAGQPGLDQRGTATYPRPVLSVSAGGHCVAKKRLESSLSTVGRWPQCNVHLQGQLVSGVHCALYWHLGRLWCIDLLSSNRTLREKQPVTWIELAVGDGIEVGEFKLVFERLSRQKDATVQASLGQQSSEADRNGSADRARRRKAWRESDSGIPDSADSALRATISAASNSDLHNLITASDSAITIGEARDSIQQTLQNTANQLPELHRIEELSRSLQGQFAQIQAEASQLAELTQRLHSASHQWAQNRAEIISLLTASLNPPALAGFVQPVELKALSAVANNEPMEPKLIAPAVETTFVLTSTTEATGDAIPRLPSSVAADVHEKAEETAKVPDPAVSRALPGGRAARNTTAVKRNELVDFVSDRIAILESHRRRKKLFIGLGVAAAILVLVGIIGGVWCSFAQSDASFPRSVVQWLQPG